jgi:hypothetical protein
VLVIWTDIAPEWEVEFNEWYDKEHIPELLGVPGFQTGRRYQILDRLYDFLPRPRIFARLPPAVSGAAF